MELPNVMSLEPCNTPHACPLIMDEGSKGQSWNRAVNKKRHAPTWEVMRESGRFTATNLKKKLVHGTKCYNRFVDYGGFIIAT